MGAKIKRNGKKCNKKAELFVDRVGANAQKQQEGVSKVFSPQRAFSFT